MWGKNLVIGWVLALMSGFVALRGVDQEGNGIGWIFLGLIIAQGSGVYLFSEE